jgi:putative ABC transport system ATP-binding protein
MSGMSTALEVRQLRKTFLRGRVPVYALRSVSLEVSAGEMVAVVGPSGCGKSTLLNLIAGLEAPTAGEVFVAGKPLAGLGEAQLAAIRRAHVGMVFQFFNLLDSMTALENVAVALLISGEPRADAFARGRELLEILGLENRADLMPADLSGGERQRLAIARALANRPTLLLADEPTGALDSEGAAEIVELFQRLNASGQTIVLVTHDRAVAASAGRVVAMRDGILVGQEAPYAETAV